MKIVYNKFKQLNLKYHKRYLIIPVVILIFFLAFFTIYNKVRKITINEFNNQQLLLAKTASQGITSFFENQQSQLTFLAKLNDIIVFSSEGKNLMSNYYQSNSNILAAITRVDHQGIILHTYPENKSVIGKDISKQDHVQRIIKEQKAIISDVFLAVQGYLAVAIHVPIFKANKFDGSIAILVPLNDLGKVHIGSIGNQKKGHIWLMSENNVEIYCSIKEHVGKPFLKTTHNHHSSHNLLKQISGKQSGTVQGQHQDLGSIDKNNVHDMYITFYKIHLGNTYWTTLISYREKEVYIALTQFRNQLIIVFLMLLIALSFYFFSLVKVRKVLNEEKKRKEAEIIIQEKSREIAIQNKEYALLNEELTKSNLKLKKAKVKAEENSLQLNLIADNLVHGMIYQVALIDEKKRQFNYVSDAVNSLYSCTPEEAMQNPDLIYGKIHPEDIASLIEKEKEALKNMSIFKAEARVIKPDGSYRWAYYISKPRLINGIPNWDGIDFDITERKQLEFDLLKAKEKAEESDQLKSAFLANISHEIRTPMNGIIGFAQLLKEPKLTEGEQQQYIKVIEESGEQMLNIINAIVDISKIEAGMVEMKVSNTNINEQIAYVYTFFKPEAHKKGIELKTKKTLKNHDANFKIDREKLLGILINLIKNALKFTNSGQIEFGYTISNNKGQSCIDFFVADTGIGIPPHALDTIFKRFVQAKTTDYKIREGAGLGLSLVKSYVELMGGKIWVKSEEGLGSTFYFSLPYPNA